MKNKVNSFTLIEITVALLISGIIVSILFRFFFFISSYRYERTKASADITEVSIARKTLLKSFADEQIGILNSELDVKVSLLEEIKENEFNIKSYQIERGLEHDTITIHRKLSELEKWDLEINNR